MAEERTTTSAPPGSALGPRPSRGEGDETFSVAPTLYSDGDVEKNEQFLVELTEPRFAVIADPEGMGAIVDAP